MSLFDSLQSARHGPWGRPLLASIQRATAEHYGLTLDVMTERDGVGARLRDRAQARQVAMYLASCLTTASQVRIGQQFGHRDHTTVIHALAQTRRRLRTDAKVQRDVRAIARAVL